jgi:septum formation protein
VSFVIRHPDVQERGEGDPTEVARENALRKARAVPRDSEIEVVLGVDTLVCLDGVIYGKPADRHVAANTLQALSGATHTVFSAIALLIGAQERLAVAQTQVSFRDLDDALLDWYLATGEWRGRAGAYAIQGAGAALVRELQGDYENVVGLPLALLLDIYPELLG